MFPAERREVGQQVVRDIFGVPLEVLRYFDAEIHESADLCWWMLARWVECEERKALAVPVWEQVDQLAFLQEIADAPADDLGDGGPSGTLRQH